MTGRDLIIYILQNHLEDEDIFKDGYFIGFMSIEQVAAKFEVGVATVHHWYSMGLIEGFEFGDALYFKRGVSDPRQ